MSNGFDTTGLIWVLTCVMLGVVGQISMKSGMLAVGRIESISELLTVNKLAVMFTNHFVLIGVALYASSSLLWLAALSRLEITLAYPLISLGYVVTAFFGKFFFHEEISVVRGLGILLILGGCFLIARP